MALPAQIHIRENAWIARIAALVLKEKSVAMVWGSTINLWGVSEEDFIKNTRWLKHELEHVAQFKRYGLFAFTCLYLWESIKKGYQNNKYEIEARHAETR